MGEAKRKWYTLGNVPIEDRFEYAMRKLAKTLDMIFNPTSAKENGFVLMVFPFDNADGRCNYISNAKREDVITLLKEQLAYFQGQAEQTGHA